MAKLPKRSNYKGTSLASLPPLNPPMNPSLNPYKYIHTGRNTHWGSQPPLNANIGDTWHDVSIGVSMIYGANGWQPLVPTSTIQGTIPNASVPQQAPECMQCNTVLTTPAQKEIGHCQEHTPDLEEIFTVSIRDLFNSGYERRNVMAALVGKIKQMEEVQIELRNQIDELIRER